MRARFIVLIAAALPLILPPTVPAEAQRAPRSPDLQFYQAAEGGTRALVPSSWRAEAAFPDQPGVRFVSPDGSARMAVWSVPDKGISLSAYMREIAEAGNVRVTYAPLRRNWLVLSGYRDDLIFYAKVVRACGRLHHAALEYPRAQKRAFDSLVRRVSHSLGARC